MYDVYVVYKNGLTECNSVDWKINPLKMYYSKHHLDCLVYILNVKSGKMSIKYQGAKTWH